MKKKSIFIVGFVLIAIMISFLVSFIKNFDSILAINNCKDYVEQYLTCLPGDEEKLKDIEIITDKVCCNDDFETCFLFSDYYKDYLYEIIFYGKFSNEERKEIKQGYFNDIVMLRLKTLAVLGEDVEYENLFLKFVDDIENCFNTRFRYKKYWYVDANYQIEHETDIFNIVTQGYEIALENTTDIGMKYLILTNLIDLYSSVGGNEDNVALYKEQQRQLINQNYDVLKNELYEMYEDDRIG